MNFLFIFLFFQRSAANIKTLIKLSNFIKSVNDLHYLDYFFFPINEKCFNKMRLNILSFTEGQNISCRESRNEFENNKTKHFIRALLQVLAVCFLRYCILTEEELFW